MKASEVSKHHHCLGRHWRAISPTKGFRFMSSRERTHPSRNNSPHHRGCVPKHCRF